MLAIITSTIFPDEISRNGDVRNVISPHLRLEQTLETITSLQEYGFNDIYLFDNSGDNWEKSADKCLADIHLFKINTYQFSNKGINEVLLLLQSLKHIPENTPILKLSGRYKILCDFKFEINGYDLAARYFKSPGGRFTMHTSCYLIRDKAFFEIFLKTSLEEHYAEYARANNKKSLRRFIKNNILKKGESFSDPPLPIEFSFATAINICKLKYNNLKYNICEGIAGANPNTVHLH